MKTATLVTLSALALSTIALRADTLRMRDGRVLTGTFEGADRNDIRFRTDGSGLQHFNVYDVDTLSFGAGNSYNQDRYPNTGTRDRFESRDRYQPRDSSYNYQGAVLPAGTPIVVRMIDGVDSDSSHTGDTYRASLDQPIIVNGQTIAPAGSDATVQVVRVQQGGRISGREEVALALASFTANGRTYDLNTNNETVSSGSRGRQSTEVIGGGAALGAIIGAIAGGGKGAAIGAASGAALGAGAQMVRGERVKVAPETRLSFSLTRDLTL